MRITKDNWRTALEKGTRFYKVSGTRITKFIFLIEYSWHISTDKETGAEKRMNVFYAFSDSKYSEAQYFNEDSLESGNILFTEYEEAKEQMWKNLVEKMKSVDEIYFNGKKFAENRGMEMVLDMGLHQEEKK